LDYLVDYILGKLKNSEKAQFPRTNFTHGYTNLTQLTAEEWPGMVLTLLVITRFEKAQEILKDVVDASNRPEQDMSVTDAKPVMVQVYSDSDSGVNTTAMNAEDLDDMEGEDTEEDAQVEFGEMKDADYCSDSSEAGEKAQVESEPANKRPKITAFGLSQVLERILSFHAFYKRGNPYNWDPSEGTHDSLESFFRIQIRELISMIVSRIPRAKGNGWDLQKLHELLHIPLDMTMFGCPSNWDAGPGESSLKYWAKRPASTALKWGTAIFTDSCAKRLHEKACFNKMMRLNQPAIAAVMAEEEVLSDSDDDDEGNSSSVPSTGVSSLLVGKPKYVFEYNAGTKKLSGNGWVGRSKREKWRLVPWCLRMCKQ
jgi:hypothetical protein